MKIYGVFDLCQIDEIEKLDKMFIRKYDAEVYAAETYHNPKTGCSIKELEVIE